MAAVSITLDGFDVVIFDLAGVFIDTASVPAVAWRQLFDDYSIALPVSLGEDHARFTGGDYRRYVDGHSDELRAHGADVGVSDLCEVAVSSAAAHGVDT